jgi:hypothetical protein
MQIAKIQDAKSIPELAATGFMTSAMEQAQLQGQGLANRLKLAQIQGAELENTIRETELSSLFTEPIGDEFVQSQAQANITEVGELLQSGGLSTAVGTTILSRSPRGFWGTVGKASTIVGIPGLFKDAFTKLTGEQQNFVAGVERLRSGLSLDALITAKSRGATFGALSDTEMRILSSSASKLGTWAVTDEGGNVLGYNAAEKDFRAELDKINNFSKLDYILKGGDPTNVGVTIQEDGTLWSRNSDGSYTQLR